jgi:hypothetical protein
MKTQTQLNGRRPAGQASYRLPIERRAVVAAGMIEENGWSQRQAAGLCCVNPAYVSLVQHLNSEDRVKLARREIRLSHLWKNYRRDLAARKAERLAAEHKAKGEERARVADGCLDRVGFQCIFEQIVCRWDFDLPLQVLDLLARRANRDFVEIIIETLGADRVMQALDQFTAPQRIAAE